MALDLTNPTLKTLLDGSPQGGSRDLAFRLAKLGSILAGVRHTSITQSSAPVIDLRTFSDPIDTGALAPCSPGGFVDVTAGGAASWGSNHSAYIIGHCPSVAITTATDITGNANGGITITPKTRRATQRPLRILFCALAGVTTTRQLYVFDGEIWLIYAATTGTIDGTETATSVVATLNGTTAAARAAQELATFAVKSGDTGAGVASESSKALIPRRGTYAAGPPVTLSPGICVSSMDGQGILFDNNLTAATLSYTPCAAVDLARTITDAAQPR